MNEDLRAFHRNQVPSGGLPVSLAIGWAAMAYPVVGMLSYQAGAWLFQFHGEGWPSFSYRVTLIAFFFSGVAMLLGFVYSTRPQRDGMLRGIIGTILASVAVFYLFWAGGLLSVDRTTEFDLKTPKVQLLLFGAAAGVAAALTFGMQSKSATSTSAPINRN